jgi:hypothetical protein
MGRITRNKDGLSFRINADVCNDLDHYGILRIRVGEIHGLKRKQLAEAVASELAFRARPHSIEPYKKAK